MFKKACYNAIVLEKDNKNEKDNKKLLEVTKMKERISFSEFLKELYKKTICY